MSGPLKLRIVSNGQAARELNLDAPLELGRQRQDELTQDLYALQPAAGDAPARLLVARDGVSLSGTPNLAWRDGRSGPGGGEEHHAVAHGDPARVLADQQVGGADEVLHRQRRECHARGGSVEPQIAHARALNARAPAHASRRAPPPTARGRGRETAAGPRCAAPRAAGGGP